MVKRFFIILCGLVMTTMSLKAEVVNDSTFTDLKTVYVNCAVKIKFVKGEEVSFNVMSDDEQLRKAIRYEYEDGNLKIYNRLNEDLDGNVDIIITTLSEFPTVRTGANYLIMNNRKRNMVL